MGIAISPHSISRELARRGWSHTDLARAARLSNATVSAACAGRRVSPTTLRLIAAALATAPTLAGVDGLLL
jgi:lambda repressor-like predicted transcriptional regulator